MRIVMVTETLGNAFGQERVVRDSTRLLRAAGHEVAFISAEDRGETERDGLGLVRGLFQLHNLSMGREFRRIRGEVLTFLFDFGPDLIHFVDQIDSRLMEELDDLFPCVFTAHSVAPTCPASGRMTKGAGICAHQSGWRCLVFQRQQNCLGFLKSDVHRAHAIWNYLEKRSVMKDMPVVASISQYLKDLMVFDGWAEEKIHVVYNPVSTRTPTTKLDAPHPLIVCVARLHPLKGVDLLLHAMKEIVSERWTLWICGDGPQRSELEALSAKLGLLDRIKFWGATAFHETQGIIASADILVQTNRGPEGFGLSVAEAGAYGVPVVVTDVPALNEIVTNEKTGLVVSPTQSKAVAEGVLRLLKDTALRKRLGDDAKAFIHGKFSESAHLKSTLELYETCLNRR